MLTSIANLIQSTQGIALMISSLLMTIAFIVFLLAVIFYINKRRSGDGDGFKQAGNMLLGSVFALFVMVAVWGMVFFLSNALGIGIGGCTSRPSTLPGVANNVDCGTGSSGVRTPSGSTGGAAQTMPRSQTTGGAGSGSNSSNDIPPETVCFYYANGSVKYCNNGGPADACVMGSCLSPLSCYIEDPTATVIGKCQ